MSLALYDKQESFILLSRVGKSQGINAEKTALYIRKKGKENIEAQRLNEKSQTLQFGVFLVL